MHIKLYKFIEKILNIIYPQTCGICGKLHSKSICVKCYLNIQNDLQYEIEKIDSTFENLIYISKYQGILREKILDYKFNEASYLYKTFSDLILKDEKIFKILKSYDTIIPVPISNKRFKERGYNQSELIAKELSKRLNIEMNIENLIKNKNIIEQSKLGKEERIKNIEGVYEIRNLQELENKKIILIDDIYTTGSTVKECAKILKQSKCKKIDVLVIAKD